MNRVNVGRMLAFTLKNSAEKEKIKKLKKVVDI